MRQQGPIIIPCRPHGNVDFPARRIVRIECCQYPHIHQSLRKDFHNLVNLCCIVFWVKKCVIFSNEYLSDLISRATFLTLLHFYSFRHIGFFVRLLQKQNAATNLKNKCCQEKCSNKYPGAGSAEKSVVSINSPYCPTWLRNLRHFRRKTVFSANVGVSYIPFRVNHETF